MTFPCMTNRGHTVQVSENSFVATPHVADEETAWKVCEPGDKGAVRVAPDLYVNVDHQASIENNKAAIQRDGATVLTAAMDRLDIARHRAALFFGR